MDIGSPRSLIYLKQARSYCLEMGLRFQTTPSSETFRFGTYPTKSIRRMTIILPTPSQTLPVHVQIVAEDIPLLIGSDVMDRYALQPLVIENALESVTEKWKIPLKRKFGHCYMCWTPPCSKHSILDLSWKYFANTSCTLLPESFTNCCENLIPRNSLRILWTHCRNIVKHAMHVSCIHHDMLPSKYANQIASGSTNASYLI